MRNKIINSISFFIIGAGACLGGYQWYEEGKFSLISLGILVLGILGSIVPFFLKSAFEKEYEINDWDHDVHGWFLKVNKSQHGISNPTIKIYQKQNGIYNVVEYQEMVLDNGDCLVRGNMRIDCKIVIK